MAVVAHDAGAARLLFSWRKPLKDLQGCLNKAQLLLSGSGWSSDLEHHARKLATEQGVPSIAVVDHWVNYRERFQRGESVILPQGLWVADREAAEMAQKTFPALDIQQLPNLWLNKIINQ